MVKVERIISSLKGNVWPVENRLDYYHDSGNLVLKL